MAIVNLPLVVQFGQGLSGQSANLQTAAIDNAGTSRTVALGTLTWTESTDAAGAANTGSYRASAPFDTTWAYPVVVKVTITNQPGVLVHTVVSAVDLITDPTAFGASTGGAGTSMLFDNQYPITPSDTDAQTGAPYYVRIGRVRSGDTVTITDKNNQDITYRDLKAGQLLNIKASRVKATGTSASELVGLK